MRTQWESLLQNLGQWQGSFTRFSPQGECLEDIPSLVSLEGLDENRRIRQVVRLSPVNAEPPPEKVFEYSSLNRSTLFFDSGAFSQGSMQWAPFAEFGAELGLIAGPRRLRLVQLFDRASQLSQLTLIREQLAGTAAPERPALSLEDLLGDWQGQAVTLYPDWRSPDTYATRLLVQRQGDQLSQQLSYPGGTLTSTATVSGSLLRFEQGAQPVQVLLLPDGASATAPRQVQARQPLFLEVGWLLQPDLRQRLIRSYDAKGGWVNLTLVTERRQGV